MTGSTCAYGFHAQPGGRGGWARVDEGEGAGEHAAAAPPRSLLRASRRAVVYLHHCVSESSSQHREVRNIIVPQAQARILSLKEASSPLAQLLPWHQVDACVSPTPGIFDFNLSGLPQRSSLPPQALLLPWMVTGFSVPQFPQLQNHDVGLVDALSPFQLWRLKDVCQKPQPPPRDLRSTGWVGGPPT